MADKGLDKLPVGLLNRPQMRLADEVAHVLRDLILRGELEPGSQLLQIQLSEQLGVSRTPLREAFRLLERDGLLRISNGNKTVEVVEVDRKSLIDTYEIREVIDGLAARLAARRGLSDDSSGRIGQAIERMVSAAESPLDLTRYSEAHADFHLAIIDAAGNPRLHEFEPLVRISTQMQLTRHLQRSKGGSSSAVHNAIRVGNENHKKIFDAIVSGDTSAAERAAQQHIRATIELLESLGTRAEADKAKGRKAAG
ncbi:GntR family transcriptional regulator [Nocardia sp. CA-135953]|uniref:GntR family transcriptional regulator n=1 Tax=Nocardia sp. CA-135953 TaxID=3239978 RepID=UPI003D9A0398